MGLGKDTTVVCGSSNSTWVGPDVAGSVILDHGGEEGQLHPVALAKNGVKDRGSGLTSLAYVGLGYHGSVEGVEAIGCARSDPSVNFAPPASGDTLIRAAQTQ